MPGPEKALKLTDCRIKQGFYTNNTSRGLLKLIFHKIIYIKDLFLHPNFPPPCIPDKQKDESSRRRWHLAAAPSESVAFHFPSVSHSLNHAITADSIRASNVRSTPPLPLQQKFRSILRIGEAKPKWVYAILSVTGLGRSFFSAKLFNIKNN